ncbi:MAG TPA: transglutaminase-like cysteine peptidase [Xanthobacteraceae bacterium]|nr:transglutaminase-like cysteine peptidase [Xanthobacteraceae bacterium]
MLKYIAHIAIVAALSVSACAEMPTDTQSLQSATEVAYQKASPIADGFNITPPAGFVGFCMRSPEACTNRGVPEATKVVVDDRMAATLVAVNDRVNDAIQYESDVQHYGAANQWTLHPKDGRGDCKDYAVAKREALRAAGLPDEALRIAIVRTPADELHAVLTVDTDKGALVMDSLTPEILPWTNTSYRWLERQSAENPFKWVSLAGAEQKNAGTILEGRR